MGATCTCSACRGNPFAVSFNNPQAMCSGPETLVPSRLRGYRAWRLDLEAVAAGRGLGLRPLRRVDMLWDVDAEATCIADSDAYAAFASAFTPAFRQSSVATSEIHGQSPAPMCSCGIYGWYDPHDTRITAGDVYGAIDVEGRVLLGQHGFRAQKATVRALAAGNNFLADWWRSQGIDVYPTLDELALAYPPDDVTALVPPAPEPLLLLDELKRASLSLQLDAQAVERLFRDMGIPRVPTVRTERTSSTARPVKPSPRQVPDVVARARAGRSAGPSTSARAPRSIDPRGAR